MRDFHGMRELLAQRLRDLPEVEGLVWAGSAADTARADEWSDLDFFVIVNSGQQERFRQDLTWLPDAAQIALSPRETAHGLKVVYDDGFVLEFAVFDRDELARATLNHHALDFGDADIAVRISAIHRPEGHPDPSTADDHIALAYALLIIGLGRHRRGEVLVAGHAIRSAAVGHLLMAAQMLLPSADAASRDALDPWRRCEVQFPGFAAALADAIARDNEAAAFAVADAAEQWLGAHAPSAGRGAAVLRRRFPG